MKRIRTLQLLGALVLLAMTAVYASAQGTPPTPTVSYPASFAVSSPLSDMQASGPAGTLKIHARRPLPHRVAAAGQENAADTALQTAAGSRLGTQEQPNFPGVGENGAIPPDPNIAVGPNHIVQVVNIDIAVFDKSGHVSSGYPKRLSSLWSALGGPCATNNAGDPVVQYDKLADRFIVTQLGSLSSPYSECIAVSTSNDPTGSYYLYSYSFGSNLNDYQKFSVWPTATNAAYLATYNLFANGSSFVGAELCAYDRTAMLSGASAAQICFTISGDGGFLPSDLDGPTAPLDGTPGLFLNFETLSSLRLYKLSPNFGAPSSSTLSAPSDISVASFNKACGGGTCVPQPSTSQQLDALGDRLMYRLAYRRFGTDHEAIVVNHSVTAGSSVGVRWYELRDTPPSTGAAFSLYQQGTFAPDSAYRWMGSIAMDQTGDMALGYSESSSSLYPSINYTSRAPGDTLGTMGAETTLQAGGGSQTGYTRWGDYTSMRIDPSDDCTFWYTGEYYTATSSFLWSTAIGSFKFSGCGTPPAPDFSISATASPLTFTAGVGGMSNGTVTVSSLNGFNSAVTLATAGACGSGGSNGISCNLGTTSLTPPANGSTNTTLVIDIGTATTPGSYSITVNGASGPLNHSTTLTVVVSAPPADFTISASPSSITVNRGSSGRYTVSLGAVNTSSSVTLSVSGLPPRTSASFSPNPVNTSGSSTLTLSTSRKASTGLYTLNITGANSNFTHPASVTLIIQ